MNNTEIRHIKGTGLPLIGDDIDTDRIIPARYLKRLSFDGLGDFVFQDDRLALKNQGKVHPFDRVEYRGASVLIVNRNFGCGSSREHAPQALHRFGIAGIIGVFFGEIFYGNSVSVGMPCVKVAADVADTLQSLAEKSPGTQFHIDLEEKKIYVNNSFYGFEIPEGTRQQFLNGGWDSTSELISDKDSIRQVAKKLPYMNHWRS